MSLNHGRLYTLMSFFVLAAGLLAAYSLQLASASDYMGYRAFAIDPRYLATAMMSIFVTGMLMPTGARKPSDFFSWLYGLFVVLPYATLYPIRNPVGSWEFALFFFTLILPVVVIRLLSAAIPGVNVPRLVTQEVIVWLIAILCIGGVLHALTNPPASAGFDLTSSYDRRIEGRSVFPAGSLSAYANAAIVNGFAPFLAFIAGWRRKKMLLLLSGFCGLAFFYLLGFKAPIFFIVLAFLIGYAVRKRRLEMVIRSIGILVGVVFLLFLIEYCLFGFSLIGDYFVRRAFSIPPYLVSAYFEFMSSASTSHWSPIEGVISSGSITFLVGESFLGIPGLNANTNTFVYQLASGGFPMYALTTLLIAGVFAVLDATYKSKHNPALMYLGFSYAMLLTEQSATTALVSSGLGVLILLNLLSGSSSQALKRTLLNKEIYASPNVSVSASALITNIVQSDDARHENT